ncbi:hypothetical protein EBR37_00815 [bacterium]|nr:hypothetical protein [bacterium]
MAYNPVVIGSQTQANSQAVTLSNDFKSPATNLPVAVTTGATGLVGGQTVGGQTVNYSLPVATNVISKDVITSSYYTIFTSTYKILYGYFAINNTNAVAYLSFVDQSSASYASTSAGLFKLMIPAYSAANLTFPIPVSFTLGIGVTAWTSFAGTTQVAASSVYLTLWVS